MKSDRFYLHSTSVTFLLSLNKDNSHIKITILGLATNRSAHPYMKMITWLQKSNLKAEAVCHNYVCYHIKCNLHIPAHQEPLKVESKQTSTRSLRYTLTLPCFNM